MDDLLLRHSKIILSSCVHVCQVAIINFPAEATQTSAGVYCILILASVVSMFGYSLKFDVQYL